MALTHAERPMLHAAVVAVREVAVERSIARCGNNPLRLGDSMRACMDVARKSHISMPAGMARRFKAVMTADTPPTLRLLLSLAVGRVLSLEGLARAGLPGICASGAFRHFLRRAFGWLPSAWRWGA